MREITQRSFKQEKDQWIYRIVVSNLSITIMLRLFNHYFKEEHYKLCAFKDFIQLDGEKGETETGLCCRFKMLHIAL